MIKRPVLSYQGSKFRIANWIISFFPDHKVYCECFGGTASVLMRKPRALTEIYNDNNSKIYDVFKLLRNKEKALELKRRLELTPYSRQEYYETDYIDNNDDDIEKVRKTIVRAFFGICAGSVNRNLSGFLSGIDNRDYKQHQKNAWLNYPDSIISFCDRLHGIILENRDALEVIKIYDTSETLHYVDPPYLMGLWNKQDRKVYKDILTDNDHISLLNLLKAVKGYVVLSSYDNNIYRDMLNDWHIEQKETMNQKRQKRIETIWISPKTWDKINYTKYHIMYRDLYNGK